MRVRTSPVTTLSRGPYERSVCNTYLVQSNESRRKDCQLFLIIWGKPPCQYHLRSLQPDRAEHLHELELRMLVSGTNLSMVSQNLVKSQVSTIIISYLDPREQLCKAQLVCRKWYSRFLPEVMPQRFKLPISDWSGVRFRIAYYPEDQVRRTPNSAISKPLYLAALTDRESDFRDRGSWYLSAGNSRKY